MQLWAKGESSFANVSFSSELRHMSVSSQHVTNGEPCMNFSRTFSQNAICREPVICFQLTIQRLSTAWQKLWVLFVYFNTLLKIFFPASWDLHNHFTTSLPGNHQRPVSDRDLRESLHFLHPRDKHRWTSLLWLSAAARDMSSVQPQASIKAQRRSTTRQNIRWHHFMYLPQLWKENCHGAWWVSHSIASSSVGISIVLF